MVHDAELDPFVPDHLEEFRQLMQDTAVNVLVTGPAELLDAALVHLVRWVRWPVSLCRLPGPLALPAFGPSALILRDVAALDEAQQRQLDGVLLAGRGPLQIVSATTHDLWAAVQRGWFSESLYYRLNTLMAEL
jgi:sigma-54 interacting transcriptional regulator